MEKQIKADLDQVVEAVMGIIVNGESGYINSLVGQYEEEFVQSLRTTLEQFVVESKEAQFGNNICNCGLEGGEG
jgi:hypothetical protein